MDPAGRGSFTSALDGEVAEAAVDSRRHLAELPLAVLANDDVHLPPAGRSRHTAYAGGSALIALLAKHISAVRPAEPRDALLHLSYTANPAIPHQPCRGGWPVRSRSGPRRRPAAPERSPTRSATSSSSASSPTSPTTAGMTPERRSLQE